MFSYSKHILFTLVVILILHFSDARPSKHSDPAKGHLKIFGAFVISSKRSLKDSVQQLQEEVDATKKAAADAISKAEKVIASSKGSPETNKKLEIMKNEQSKLNDEAANSLKKANEAKKRVFEEMTSYADHVTEELKPNKDCPPGLRGIIECMFQLEKNALELADKSITSLSPKVLKEVKYIEDQRKSFHQQRLVWIQKKHLYEK